MAKEPRRVQKSEVLSMRMDPKTRFILDVLARLKGQPISTVVERAIVETADKATIVQGDFNQDTNWRDYWHINEGVRWLRVASELALFPSAEDEAKLYFIRKHWPFFYISSKRLEYNESFIDVLWPRIDEFWELWKRTRSTDFFAAGKTMSQTLSAAGVKPPDWPEKSATAPAASGKNEMDDEIPF